MPDNIKQAVILAAGESSRFWPFNNRAHKCEMKILGRPLIYWTIASLAEKKINHIVVIVRPDCSFQPDLLYLAEKLKIKISFVRQEKPLGTGRALALAEKYIKHPFFVFWPYKIEAGQIVEEVLLSIKKTKNQIVFG